MYNDSGSTLLAEKIWITQEQYVNASIGTASTKRIVSNLEYEADINEEKRTIQLLKREYLDEFVEEFKTLMKLGV
jgi:protein-tyrosine phosphatase